MSMKNIRIGDLLIERKIISRKQLERALEEQRLLGRKMLGRVLIDNGFAEESQVLEVLAQQLNIPFAYLLNLSS